MKIELPQLLFSYEHALQECHKSYLSFECKSQKVQGDSGKQKLLTS